MKLDSINRYVALRASLLKEQGALEARLARIQEALSGQALSRQAAAPEATAPSEPKPRRRRRRRTNKLSLKKAVLEVTKGKPLAKPEILAGVKKLGYKFTASNPRKYLDVILYAKGQFKRSGGKFRPA